MKNTKEEDPTGLLNEGFRYRDLETGTFITRDPIGNTLMMPTEKWFVDGKSVSEDEYEEALNPGVPQAGNGPTKTAKDSCAEADYHAATSEEGAVSGQKSHMHTAAAGFPNLYTYVNQNPWTFFDPEGLAPNAEQRAIAASAHAMLNVSTASDPNTKGGGLGCALAVSWIFKNGTGQNILPGQSNVYSTNDLHDGMGKKGSDYTKVPMKDAQEGDIVVTPRGPKGARHTGVVVEDGKIISNSSSGFAGTGKAKAAKGTVQQNYTTETWKQKITPRNPKETTVYRYTPQPKKPDPEKKK